MRILQIITPSPFGGAESVVQHLSESLKVAGQQVQVLALGVQDAAHPWVADLRERGLDVDSPVGRRRRDDFALVRHAIKRHQADVVHSHGYRADIACLLGRPKQAVWVSTVHGFTATTGRLRAYQWLDLLALRRATQVIAVSTPLQEELPRHGIRPERIRLIRNAVPPTAALSRAESRQILGLPGDGPVVGWVGRFSYEKGPDHLPEVARALLPSGHLALIGDGPLREEIVRRLQTVVGEARVHWCGSRPDAARLMAAFDVLLLSSRTEGMPMVILEAMSSGVPAVAFDVGDVRYVVSADTGWLIPAGDLGAMSRALSAALQDPAGLRERGAAAARAVRHICSMEAWTNAHLDCYRGRIAAG